MRGKVRSFTTDFSFVAMVVLGFIAAYFLSADSGNQIQNSLILCLVSAILLITYFTSLVIGLVINAVFIFLLFGYTLISSANTGIPISANTYFWMIWPPLMTLAVGTFTSQTSDFQAENAALHNHLEEVSLIDEATGLRNLRDFENGASIYMNISERYNMPLELIVWRLRYQSDLFRMVGNENKGKVVRMICDCITDTLREEDLLYIVNDSPYEWALLMFTDYHSSASIIERIKENTEQLDFSSFTKLKVIPVDLETSVKVYDQKTTTPLSFLESARPKNTRG